MSKLVATRHKREEQELVQNKDPHRYDDMLLLERPLSKKYRKMPLLDRAAQFSSFAALTGHKEAIQETGRRTDRRIDLDESVIERLNEKLLQVQERIQEKPEITATYFVADEKKAGGVYKTLTAQVKKLDQYKHNLVFTDGTEIPILDLYDITADWMQNVYFE